MTLTFKHDLDRGQDKPAQWISRPKVILFKSYYLET